LPIADFRLRIADLELMESFDYDNPKSAIRNPQFKASAARRGYATLRFFCNLNATE